MFDWLSEWLGKRFAPPPPRGTLRLYRGRPAIIGCPAGTTAQQMHYIADSVHEWQYEGQRPLVLPWPVDVIGPE